MAVDIKKALLNLGEENAKVLLKEVLRPLAQEFIEKSPNKVDDAILPFLDMAEKALISAIDKIDGEVG